jgi:hypothetical protein
MTLVQVVNLRVQAEGAEESWATDAEHHLLLDPQFGPAAVEFAVMPR